ncbi:MAG: hypothetical protein KJ600_01170 [Nanoarchaeota archaeon]|nr:hypothetical protein [Nanoarchaeota archaeon]MBU1103153.1 hypothetical protein [Nanoarchaeota archaeon]
MTDRYQNPRPIIEPTNFRIGIYSLLVGLPVVYKCGGCRRTNSVSIKAKDLPETRCNNCDTTNRLPLITPPPREED